MPIAPQVRALAIQISSLEEKASNQSAMLDRVLDLHNDLTDWATNTDHSDAAQEVMTILEKYAHPAESRQTTAV